MGRYDLKVPKVFFDDHASRGCVVGQYEETYGIVKENKTHYWLSLSLEDALDLVSDANHYSDCHQWIGSDWFGMAMSARATKKAVVKQMLEQGYEFTERQAWLYDLRRMTSA